MRDLRPLFEPRSVAVVGASNGPAKWGQWLARGALRGEHLLKVFLVNTRCGEVLGRTAFTSLAELPESPELVALGRARSGVRRDSERGFGRGRARARSSRSAGLGERRGRTNPRGGGRRTGSDGGRRPARPNCNGLCDAAAEVELGLDGLPPGPIGFVSQSGNLCYEVAQLAADVGLGLSRVVSIGNRPTSTSPLSWKRWPPIRHARKGRSSAARRRSTRLTGPQASCASRRRAS